MLPPQPDAAAVSALGTITVPTLSRITAPTATDMVHSTLSKEHTTDTTGAPAQRDYGHAAIVMLTTVVLTANLMIIVGIIL